MRLPIRATSPAKNRSNPNFYTLAAAIIQCVIKKANYPHILCMIYNIFIGCFVKNLRVQVVHACSEQGKDQVA